MLMAAMLGGVMTGIHAHVGEHSCPMAGIADDCCATAREQGGTPEISAARLCCALNCPEPGTTVPTDTFKISPPASSVLHTGAIPSAAATSHLMLSPLYKASSPPTESHPAYIRHLALLI